MELPTHNYFLWGPYLTKMKVEESLCEKLLMDGRELRTSHRNHLAGKIEKEFKYDNLKYYQKQFQPYIDSWIHGWYRQLGAHVAVKGKLVSLWINFQKPKEHNPVHIHPGADVSFALHLNAPIAMIGEKQEETGVAPGRLSFLYGEERAHTIAERSFTPEKNVMFMFPGNLRHYVTSFNSDVERISVAGNVKFEHASK